VGALAKWLSERAVLEVGSELDFWFARDDNDETLATLFNVFGGAFV
jgi:hypothetical protein